MTFPLRDKRESSADEHLDTARLVFLLVADDGHEAQLELFLLIVRSESPAEFLSQLIKVNSSVDFHELREKLRRRFGSELVRTSSVPQQLAGHTS